MLKRSKKLYLSQVFKLYAAGILILSFMINSCQNQDNVKLNSPNGNIKVVFNKSDGKLIYQVIAFGKQIIKDSEMGMVFQNNDTISAGMNIVDVSFSEFNETWEQPWGEKRLIHNNYNQVTIRLQEPNGKKRKMNIVFRVFNNGIGFRYEFPEQKNIADFVIMDELTEFVMNNDYNAWWIPAYRNNRYEYLYQRTLLSEMDTVHTPLTIETKDNIYISLHEAALVEYASMTLVSMEDNTLKCDLVPWSDGTKVKTSAPMKTPWRTIQIADNAGGLITSYLILNLNTPNKLQDISWIQPVKYMGIWWGMHIGKYTFWESENQGATTENAKYYIDFASKHGIKYLLIEGWNKGWTPEWYEDLLHKFSFTECADGFDFDEVTRYAKLKGISIIGYHETGSNIENYLAQIDAGMKMYHDAGIHNIKIGQVGSRLQMKEWHHGQYGVDYYNHVLKKAAEYQLAVNFHEPIKPTGLRRTMPNLMAGEGARGQEYNAWSEGNPPDHTCILPFTRLLAGPMDFTPGIFEITSTRLHTTLAKQLALYVTNYSPVQMLADLPENYDGHPAFQFLLDVPVDWEDTQVLEAKIGDYLTIARKDRNSDNWYLGSITDEKARTTVINLDFLDDDAKYMAKIYADGKNAAYDKNPEEYKIDTTVVDSKGSLTLKLAPGGGCAIEFKKL